jgi:hypothetical protein
VIERAVFLRPGGLTGAEALHARFVEHAYLPHSHPTWTVAVMQAGAARFEVDATKQRADRGELFVLEPEAVHTGMAAVPEGWGYQVLYLDPELVHDWAERDASAPRAARWVVFRDPSLRAALLRMHAAFAAGETGLERDELVVDAVAAPSTRRSGARVPTSQSAGTGRSRSPSSPHPPASAASSSSAASVSTRG